jgi:branched-chain amino acid transport system ATP-binding protein
MEPGDLLTVHDLTKSYGSLQAVDRLSFCAQAGEVLGITGPNGAGKTTMFDVVSGITAPSAGNVKFDGRDITDLGPDRICHAGLVRTFQFNATFAGLTLMESVLVGAMYGSYRPGWRAYFGAGRIARGRAEEAIDFVGLSDQRKQRIADAPVFEQKLAMIASAIATEPKLLMMDEPVAGLVPGEIDRVAELVLRLKDKGITILIIEHVMRFLTSFSTRILVMHHGAKLFEGAPDQMMRDQAVREVYLGANWAVHV